MTKATAHSVADWHACLAIRSYYEGKYELYFRHISTADSLWRVAEYLNDAYTRTE